jgi:hypothetical protein
LELLFLDEYAGEWAAVPLICLKDRRALEDPQETVHCRFKLGVGSTIFIFVLP